MDRLLDATEDDLYRLVGEDLSRHAGLPADPAVLVERGRKWFNLNRPRLQLLVCESTAVRAFLARSDEIALVGAIIDVIGGACDTVAPGTVATLIVKIGLERFCRKGAEAAQG
jgi:hypothetical protein